mmetsp:Transcript_4781/g.11419  ORF Transcript_4781/g.11419 Transcript_4781/m.11419 type:complete len:98 (-) Transcript_4781:207-500(-)|eukprot:CAMPEP_0173422080 /NCGR_PEP_ID=MMETSP1357-20121228/2922_1 /TAXON_ID=77926 /ORGANISM="Hemiselmis rufescens, Strain PCC563" /LENGTH=97 /DNA_ID=CAMNT_0014385055 /DNA_START=21 /DNA_END=314 /DNA_ORIENTATION=-
MRTIFVVCVLALIASAMAFAPVTPAVSLKLRAPACSTAVKMADEPKEDLSKGNDPISLFVNSITKLFKKSEDDYPAVEPPSGFSQTPTKPTRNKGEW